MIPVSRYGSNLGPRYYFHKLSLDLLLVGLTLITYKGFIVEYDQRQLKFHGGANSQNHREEQHKLGG